MNYLLFLIEQINISGVKLIDTEKYNKLFSDIYNLQEKTKIFDMDKIQISAVEKVLNKDTNKQYDNSFLNLSDSKIQTIVNIIGYVPENPNGY